MDLPLALSYDRASIAHQSNYLPSNLIGFGSGPRTTPVFRLDSFYPTTNVPVSRLMEYRLERFPWADNILDTTKDALLLQLNETITLKVTKDRNAPKSSSGDTDCGNAVQGGAGLCVYLTRCESAQSITVDDYKSNYCLVDQIYAGVCCQKKHIDL